MREKVNIFVALLFVLCTFWLIFPFLFSDGMFMDGLFYAVVSRNLSQNVGSFWNLRFSDTHFSQFNEHPPLVFGLQSIFFKLFGDSYLVERFYSAFTFIIACFLIFIIWRKISKHNDTYFLPLFLFISIPLVSWSYSNNMLENTLLIFTNLSIYLSILAIEYKTKYTYFYSFLSGVALFCAFLSKGFVGLFPLSFLFFALIFKKLKINQFIKLQIAQLLGLILVSIIIFSNQSAFLAINRYIDKQVINSLLNVKTVDSRFFIIEKAFLETIPLLLICLLLIFSTKIKFKDYKISDAQKKWIYIFILTAMSGILPIMISQKQSGFYILPTFPLISIFFGLCCEEAYKKILERLSNRIKLKHILISASILMASIVFVSFNLKLFERDKEILHDVYKISKYVGANTIISIPYDLANEWSIYGYFQRYGKISLEVTNSPDREYFICKKGKLLSNYKRLDIPLKHFDLHQKK